MRRVVVLAALAVLVWLARDARWAQRFNPLPPASPHDAYLRELERAGLAESPLVAHWVAASDRAVAEPLRVILPHDETTPFDAERPVSHAFQVTLNRGQRVDVIADAGGDMPAEAFVDVFEPGDETDEEPDHQGGGIRALQYEATEDRDIIVRVQPELLRAGRLRVRLRAMPALRFPVQNARVTDLQSGFGDPRDSGRRPHEGVDIFARRGTPVLSATDGIVTRVGEGGLGGRVVWVWNPQRGLMLYYAHLDEQLVSTGERVRAGDVLGTVGNTGNARTTPPHLHFGIYQRGSGAIDPYWFIAPARPSASSRR